MGNTAADLPFGLPKPRPVDVQGTQDPPPPMFLQEPDSRISAMRGVIRDLTHQCSPGPLARHGNHHLHLVLNYWNDEAFIGTPKDTLLEVLI